MTENHLRRALTACVIRSIRTVSDWTPSAGQLYCPNTLTCDAGTHAYVSIDSLIECCRSTHTLGDAAMRASTAFIDNRMRPPPPRCIRNTAGNETASTHVFESDATTNDSIHHNISRIGGLLLIVILCVRYRLLLESNTHIYI